MSRDDLKANSKDLNDTLSRFNSFMLEQAEINDYDQLAKVIVLQTDRLLNPVATIFNEYDHGSRALSVKEIKAREGILDIAIQFGGNKILSTVTPVDDQMYQQMTSERVVLLKSINEISAGAVPEIVSQAVGKVLNIKCCLALAYVLDDRLYGTMGILLNEMPQDYHLELLKTYAYFTAVSLRRIKSDQALRARENELKTVTDNMTDIVSMADAEGRFTYLSKSNYRLLGYEPSELIGKHILELIHENDVSFVGKVFSEGIAEGRTKSRIEYRVYKKDGSYIWVETLGSMLFDAEGQISGAVFTTRDVTERKAAEKALTESELKYRRIAENISDVVWIADMNFEVTYISPSVEKILGETAEEHLKKTVEQKFTPSSLEKIVSVFQEEIEKESDPSASKDRSRIIEVEHYRADGSIIWASMHIKAVRDSTGNPIGFQGVTRDITERKVAEDHIRYISYHDNLTGLYNRHYYELCEQELQDMPLVSVIMTDINGLKLVNDTYGHASGDKLLIEYARLLRRSFKKSDLIFRWGGDEFIIILKNTAEAKSWELCNRLIKHCGETFVKDIPLSISVGISSKVSGKDLSSALTEAEDMMYKNKLNESKSSKNLIMKTLLQTLSEKSFETKEHIDRMSAIGKKFGERLKLSPSELSRLETLTMLHDIGKINIDKHILLKKTHLTDEEWEEIKKHPEVGYRITRTAEEFAYVAEEILSHHERWDGQGYPRGLKGEAIPYLSRVLNLADSYDVMCNGRPYKQKLSFEKIIAEIERCTGNQFDPDLAVEFIAFLKDERTNCSLPEV